MLNLGIFLDKYLELFPEKKDVIDIQDKKVVIYLGDIPNKSTFDEFEYTLLDTYLVVPFNLSTDEFRLFRTQLDIFEARNYQDWTEYENTVDAESNELSFIGSGFVHYSGEHFCFSDSVTTQIAVLTECLIDAENNYGDLTEKYTDDLVENFDFLIELFIRYLSVSSHNNHMPDSSYRQYTRGAFIDELTTKTYVKESTFVNGQEIPTLLTEVTTGRKVKSIDYSKEPRVLGPYEVYEHGYIFKGKLLTTTLVEYPLIEIISSTEKLKGVRLEGYTDNLKYNLIQRKIDESYYVGKGDAESFSSQLIDQFGRVYGDVSV